ncbi:hypothetical protein WAI453_009556 [Rhynchosporium graminicola]|uniref:F-box domain-containing protein n=1 Tax=Rhynchosporium graminicola TaxID=2792576 RepID=A0A1E1KSZ0_9HELO|nr:uncharacterized protein RCO7_02764 [Rhynchosporium commune]
MPGIPLGHARRRGTVPIKKPQLEDVWHRSLYVLGLQEMNAPPPPEAEAEAEAESSTPAVPDLETASPIVSLTETSNTSLPAMPQKRIVFDDLPIETKKEIFKHATSHDLITLSLVSKLFRDLAAERIYRNFHILFPDEDDPSNDYPYDCLAGGLETFATSDYNYGQYLKEFIVETESGGTKGTTACSAYTNELSCGKFMNTLLLLTIRQAKTLERFQWDIRVELSRPVWRELHKIETLKHLHVRMQTGRSVYQPLAPLPNSVLPPAPGQTDSAMPGSLLHPLPPILPVPAGSANSFPFGVQIAKIYLQPPIGKLETKTPPTFSNFKLLRTLTVVDMDSLEYLDELKECIQNSSTTLRSLKLSFSDALINSSRKPLPDPQSDDDSDQEDEFGQIIPPGHPPPNPALGASDPNGPLKILKAQEEKKRQEAALAKILGVEHAAPIPKPKLPSTPKTEPEKPKVEEDPKRRFIRNLAPVAAKLMGHVKAAGNISDQAKETLAMIEKAAKLYLEATENKADATEEKTDNAPVSVGSSTTKSTPDSSSASTDGVEDAAIMTGAVGDEEPGLFDKPEETKVNPDVSNPEDFDVEGPEGGELIMEAPEAGVEITGNEAVAPDTAAPEVLRNETAAIGPETELLSLLDGLDDQKIGGLDEQKRAELWKVLIKHRQMVSIVVEMEQEGHAWAVKVKEFTARLESGAIVSDTEKKMVIEANAAIQMISQKVAQLSGSMNTVREHLDELKCRLRVPGALDSAMTEYVRNTRGLTLEALSIYMIPTKASVLSKGVDLHVLQSITLLNVGTQSPFWNLLGRENKLSPLPLHKIHTDNVTLPFLLCLSQLGRITELILMERISKDRVESNALKSTVTMDQIRKMVLKKHAPTIRILVIRNDTISMDWGLNIKTAMLLCERAKNLEELGCSMSIRPIHTILQYMSDLPSLRVLHMISLHNPEDQCTWAFREFRKFIVDALCHTPAMNLEYIALDQAVDRLVRRKPMPKPKTTKADKKGKGKEMNWTSAKALAELVMGTTAVANSTTGVWTENGKYDFPDSSDDEDGIVKTGLRVEIIDGIRFSDVVDVRIFERDVLTGKL